MKTDKKLQARELYIFQGRSQSEIATLLDVDRKTVYRWIIRGRWMEMKVATGQAPVAVLQDLYNHISEVNKKIYGRAEDDRCPTLSEVEMLRKLVTMTKVYEKRHVGLYVQAFEELTEFIYGIDIELAKRVTGMADKYLRGAIFNKQFNIKDDLNAIVDNIPPDDDEEVDDDEQKAA